MTLMILQERMTELRERYDLTAADVNLDLGPLGSCSRRRDAEVEKPHARVPRGFLTTS